MSQWPSAKAKRLLAALLRTAGPSSASPVSQNPRRPDWPDVVFAFHDSDEGGPRMLARIANAYRTETRGPVIPTKAMGGAQPHQFTCGGTETHQSLTNATAARRQGTYSLPLEGGGRGWGWKVQRNPS